jgi:hypothetical protein
MQLKNSPNSGGRSRKRADLMGSIKTCSLTLFCSWIRFETRKLFLINIKSKIKHYDELLWNYSLFYSLISVTVSYIHVLFFSMFRKSFITGTNIFSEILF